MAARAKVSTAGDLRIRIPSFRALGNAYFTASHPTVTIWLG
jgi:hypothetical protein